MQYARLGETGLIVSRLALGSMTFGSGAGIFASVAKVDQKAANDLVARAIDGGINFFNSADVYAGGESERILGKAIGVKRQGVVIATKVGNRMGEAVIEAGLSRRHILDAADASLSRLGTDYIDVYLVHKVDPLTPIEETIEALEDLVRAGKVRYVGFSNWSAWQAAKAVGIQRARGWTPFRAAEMYYSLVGRDLEHDVVPFCADAGIGVMVWSPLAGGFFSGN
jgi:aryl-alcohol dehydrogenase-like predicted oxidoreductase